MTAARSRDKREQGGDRFHWALELLEVGLKDRILEIGCGYGMAASLVCERLGSGRITAIDRSPPMIERAVRRNREHVESGKATFQAVALENASFDDEQFDKAFVVNVRLFRAHETRQAEVLRRHLAPSGTLYLVQQHPSARRTEAVTEELKSALERHGFTIRGIDSNGAGDALMTCIVATLQTDLRFRSFSGAMQ